MAKTDSVSVQMADILDTVSKNVKGVLETESMAVAKECVQRLRSSSPRQHGDYSKGWKVSKKKGADLVVHNATDYQLTHLLENGHAIVNKKGTYGRTNGIKHIKPAEEYAQDELPRRIMEKIE